MARAVRWRAPVCAPAGAITANTPSARHTAHRAHSARRWPGMARRRRRWWRVAPGTKGALHPQRAAKPTALATGLPGEQGTRRATRPSLLKVYAPVPISTRAMAETDCACPGDPVVLRELVLMRRFVTIMFVRLVCSGEFVRALLRRCTGSRRTFEPA